METKECRQKTLSHLSVHVVVVVVANFTIIAY